MKIEVDKNFTKKLNKRLSKNNYQVGILQDKRHKQARDKSEGLKTFRGGLARRTSSKDSDVTIGEISAKFQQGWNYLIAPFKKKSPEIDRFVKEALKLTFRKSTQKKVEARLVDVIRKPILSSVYGSNSLFTARHKGFNRFMIDTGQFFNAIKARMVKNV